MAEKYLIKEVTLTRLVKFMNETFCYKKTNKKFDITDIQGYVRRGYIPEYLGGNIIEESNKDSGAKLYNVLNKL